MYGSNVLGVVGFRKIFAVAITCFLIIITFRSVAPCPAALVVQGDVSPADPATWTGETSAVVGETEWGSLDVVGGDEVVSGELTLGEMEGASGALTVGGPASSVDVDGWLTIGDSGAGTVYVVNGGTLESHWANIGAEPGSNGSVSVTGAGSTWTGRSGINIAVAGSGTLNVGSGARVTSNLDINIGQEESGAIGTVTVDGAESVLESTESVNLNSGSLTVLNGGRVFSKRSMTVGAAGKLTLLGADSTLASNGGLHVAGSVSLLDDATAVINSSTRIDPTAEFHFDGTTLTTYGLFAEPASLTGVGTIHTNGLVTDWDLTFDSPDSLEQTFVVDELPGQEITIHLTQSAEGYLGAGYSGTGKLTISNGVGVDSRWGYLGYGPGSEGQGAVTGRGTNWDCRALSVGFEGRGTMAVTNGGFVDVQNMTWIAVLPGSEGALILANFDSSLTSHELWVGRGGQGTIQVLDGATVKSRSAIVGSQLTNNLGAAAPALGTATVEGLGSTWSTSELKITNGSFEIREGAMGNCRTAEIGTPDSGPQTSSMLLVQGPGSTFSASERFDVGGVGEASVEICNGGVLSTMCASIANWFPYTEGEMTVSGVGSTWTNMQDLVVGGPGTGTLSIADSGIVSTASASLGGNWSGSQGNVNVEGRGSAWMVNQDLTVGEYGNGALTVSRGGLVTSGNACIGERANSNGTVTVEHSYEKGMASRWINRGQLTVGKSGSGTLCASYGARVESGWAVIAPERDSVGIVEVTRDAEWINDYSLKIGGRGDALLHISDGGTLRSGSAILQRESGTLAWAKAIVEGEGTLWITDGKLEIRPYEGGVGMAIREGGIVQAEECYAYPNATILLDVGEGSQLIADRVVYGGHLCLTADAGTLSDEYTPFAVGTWAQATPPIPLGGVWNDEAQTFTVHDTLSTTSGETVAINLAKNQRLGVQNGQESGGLSLSFNPDSTTANGSSEIHVTANANDAYGRRNSLLDLLAQDALLAAHWDIDTDMSAENGWCGAYLSMEVEEGLEDVRLWAGNSNGWHELKNTFFVYTGDTVDFTMENSWLGGHYTGGLISLAVTAGDILSPAATLPGDLNGDGLVGSDDLDLIRAHWGTSNTTADVTADGIVDSADLDVVRANWGTTAAAAVPEPGIFLLLTLGAMIAVFRRP